MGVLVALMVKRLSAKLETQVQSLGREDPLEKEMATHFFLAHFHGIFSCLENPMDRGA